MSVYWLPSIVNVTRCRMGNKTSSPPPAPPDPQVRERHVHALYINIPVPPDVLIQHNLVQPPACPSLFHNRAYISIVIDNLYKLETPMGTGFCTVPGMSGWMMKINILITCPPPPGPNSATAPPLHGYQIHSLDFQHTTGLSGWIKQKGAIQTQKVPSYLSLFDISSNPGTGTALPAEGTEYSAVVTDKHHAPLVTLQKNRDAQTPITLKAPIATKGNNNNGQDHAFIQFVVNRPHKFLLQNDHTFAFASWQENSYCMDGSKGCIHVQFQPNQLQLPVLLARFPPKVVEAMDLSNASCFLQPEYNMVDCKNTNVTWSSPPSSPSSPPSHSETKTNEPL